MKGQRKITKGEGVLLCLTALFLCVLLGCWFRDLRITSAPVSIETEHGGWQEVPEGLEVPEPLPPEPVDLNRAGVSELAGLPGIGDVLAGRILDYRDANGPFSSTEELLNVSGIGEKKLAALEGLVTVSGVGNEAGGGQDLDGTGGGFPEDRAGTE